MKIHLNGELKEIEDNLSLEQLLRNYKINPKTVVVERNRHVISKHELGQVRVCQEDQIEVVQFVGGGSA